MKNIPIYAIGTDPTNVHVHVVVHSKGTLINYMCVYLTMLLSLTDSQVVLWQGKESGCRETAHGAVQPVRLLPAARQ